MSKSVEDITFFLLGLGVEGERAEKAKRILDAAYYERIKRVMPDRKTEENWNGDYNEALDEWDDNLKKELGQK